MVSLTAERFFAGAALPIDPFAPPFRTVVFLASAPKQAMMVFQIQITKRQGVVPMTRDYILAERPACGNLKEAIELP
jgi:hypothetical protein